MSEIVKKYPQTDFVTPLSNRLRSHNTPDFKDLKKQRDIPVMFLDSFKIGGMYHCMIEKMPYLGEGISVSEWFQQRECTRYDDPLFVQYEKKPPVGTDTGCVLGDVFVLDVVTILEIDRFLKNTELMIRTPRWVWMLDQKSPFKEDKKTSLKVWIYLANPRFFEMNPYTTVKANQKTRSGKPLYDFDAQTQSYLNRQFSMVM